MVRRNSDQELNPEEFMERNNNNQDGEEGNELLEILRGVKGSQEEDSLVENAPIAGSAAASGRITLIATTTSSSLSQAW